MTPAIEARPVRFLPKIRFVKLLLFVLLFAIAVRVAAQPLSEKDRVTKKFAFTEVIPEKLLSGRSVVLYEEAITNTELEETQKMFQQAGIDAVAYFITDHVLAGPDPERAFATYLTNRSIEYLIFFEKENNYSLTVVPFNNKRDFVDPSAPAWRQSDPVLKELLMTVFRFAVSNLKKQNLLINEVPETDIGLKYFNSRRYENFTNDAKAFRIAVPRWGNEKDDAELAEILKAHFPVKYELVDPALDERELGRAGFISVLRFVHTRGSVAKKILGYDLSQVAKSLTSVYYNNGEADLKTISANEPVYKFYVKHIEYGNIFLGKGWDADVTWQQALKNHLMAMREALQF
jgi:hypothetical protein